MEKEDTPLVSRRPVVRRGPRLAIEAAKVILAGRDPVKDRAQVLITLDHTIATLLLVAMDRDHIYPPGMEVIAGSVPKCRCFVY